MRITEKDSGIIVQPSTATERVFIGFVVLGFSCVVAVAAAWIFFTAESMVIRAVSAVGLCSTLALDFFFFRMRTMYFIIIDTAGETISFDERSYVGLGKNREALPLAAVTQILVRLEYEPSANEWKKGKFYFAVSLALNDGRKKSLGRVLDSGAQKNLELIQNHIHAPFGFIATEATKKLLTKYKKPYANLFIADG